MFCAIGNYSVSNNPVDVYLCTVIGVLGYVLVPLLEEHLRRAKKVA